MLQASCLSGCLLVSVTPLARLELKCLCPVISLWKCQTVQIYLVCLVIGCLNFSSFFLRTITNVQQIPIDVYKDTEKKRWIKEVLECSKAEAITTRASLN